MAEHTVRRRGTHGCCRHAAAGPRTPSSSFERRGHANARLLRVAATLRLHGVIVFKDRGIRAVAVYSGPTSAPRAVFLGSCAFLARSAGGDGCVCVPGDVERHRRRSLTPYNASVPVVSLRPAFAWWNVGFLPAVGYFLLLFRIHLGRRWPRTQETDLFRRRVPFAAPASPAGGTRSNHVRKPVRESAAVDARARPTVVSRHGWRIGCRQREPRPAAP
jgi:hypothetical protein